MVQHQSSLLSLLALLSLRIQKSKKLSFLERLSLSSKHSDVWPCSECACQIICIANDLYAPALRTLRQVAE